MTKYFLLLLIAFSLFSCHSVKRTAVKKEVPLITEGRLLKNIEENELNFTSLYSRRADVSLDINGKSNNLKAVLKIQRDSFIWISALAPLGIEVGRILLTPDSVKFMDTYHKRYFIADYDYFYDKFGIETGFDCFQRILTNAFLTLEDCGGKEVKREKLKFERGENDYVLFNVQTRAIDRKIKKYFKKKRKNKDFALVLQKIHIDPGYFRPVKVSLEDVEEDIGVSAVYTDFKENQGKVFPEKMVFTLLFDSNKIQLELKFLRLEFGEKIVPNFKVPAKYKRIEK